MKVEGEIFELASRCLVGVDGEEVFNYPPESEFPCDEFHCVIQMETDLYGVSYRTEDNKNFEIVPIEITVENGEFIVYGMPYDAFNKEVIYRTRYIKGLPFKALQDAIGSYLKRFVFYIRKRINDGGMVDKDPIKLNNGSEKSWEEYKAFVRSEQKVFSQ